MSVIEKRLLESLIELETVVREAALRQPKPPLIPLFSKIDELTHQLPAGTDPALLHYLHKRSYQKARLWLQGREEENAAGNCPH